MYNERVCRYLSQSTQEICLLVFKKGLEEKRVWFNVDLKIKGFSKTVWSEVWFWVVTSKYSWNGQQFKFTTITFSGSKILEVIKSRQIYSMDPKLLFLKHTGVKNIMLRIKLPKNMNICTGQGRHLMRYIYKYKGAVFYLVVLCPINI